ncbi:MAG: hypothetical protein HY668_01505 [Chloroflexi bacterium]|nr:hypothetical protein [Chloroflexota bacterium]
MSEYKVVWPRGQRALASIPYARRPDGLNGKTIGELWDWVFRGDEVYSLVEQELARRYPGIKFVSYKAFGSIHGGSETKSLGAIVEKLKQNGCDAVISAMGC